MKILRVRLDAELGEGLDRLKTERHVNVSAWVRSLIRPALAEQLGTARGSVGALPPSAPESPPPATAPGTGAGSSSWADPWVESLEALGWLLGITLPGRHPQAPRMIWSGVPSRSRPMEGRPGSPTSSRSWNGPRISSWSAIPGNLRRRSCRPGLSSSWRVQFGWSPVLLGL